MTASNPSGPPSPLTWGYKPGTGYWSVDLPLPEAPSWQSLNRLTLSCLERFVDAFSAVCRPVEVRLDLMYFSAGGSLAAVEEGKKFHAEGKEADHLYEAVRQMLEEPGAPFASALFLDCDALIRLPPPDTGDRRIEKAGDLYIGWVVLPDGEDKLSAEEGSARFETGIDVWLPQTFEPASTRLRDNHDWAAQNSPRLTDALRRWQAAQSAVTEWGSSPYPAHVNKEGFRLQAI